MSRSPALLCTFACASLLAPPTASLVHASPPGATMPGKPPSSAKPGFDIPKGGPPTPGVVELPKGESCKEPRIIKLPKTNVWFYRMAGSWDTHIADAKTVTKSIEVNLRTTKRRIFVDFEGLAASHNQSNGQTGYYARSSNPVEIAIPNGCEIASISSSHGTLSETAPPTTKTVELYGGGLIASASCQDTYSDPDHEFADLPLCYVTLQPIEVRLRPATVTCANVEVSPAAMFISATRNMSGDNDLGGSRVQLNFGVQVVGDEKSGKVKALGTMYLKEIGGDHSEYGIQGTPKLDLFDVALDAPGCRIKNRVKAIGEYNTTTLADAEKRPQQYSPPKGAGGILRTITCSVGRPGPEEFYGYGTAMYCGHGEYEPVVVELVPDKRRRRPRHWVGG